MDEKDLKIEALLERVADLTRTYENKVADLRVALTVATQERDNAAQERDNAHGEYIALAERNGYENVGEAREAANITTLPAD